MLGKLLKYEFKATGRIFLPIYVAMLVFAGVNRLISEITPKNQFAFLEGIAAFIYVMLIAATFVLTFVVMIQRFYKNLMGDEGYLMFTLPVKPSTHIVCKTLISFFWLIVSFVITMLSIFILAVNSLFFQNMGNAWNTLVNGIQIVFTDRSTLFIIELIILVLVNIFSNILMIYTAIALGHLFHRHKLLASFGMYLAISVIIQIVSSLVQAFPIVQLIAGADGSTALPNSTLGVLVTSNIFPITIALDLICAVIFFIVTKLIFAKRLNLE